MAPRCPKMAPRRLQYGIKRLRLRPERLQDASRLPQEASRRLQDRPQTLQDASKTASRMQTIAKNTVFFNVFCRSPMLLSRRPKTVSRGFKIALRLPED